MYKFLFLLLVCFSLVNCTISPLELSNIGKIIDVKRQQEISLEQVINEFLNADYVLIGEEHDNFLHHQLEDYLITRLEQKRPLNAVVVEMLTVAQQPQVQHLQQEIQQHISYSSDIIRQKIDWQHWDWKMYQDFILHRLVSVTPLIAANLTATEVQQIMQGAEPLKGNLSIRAEVQQKIAQLIQSHHFNVADIHKLVQVQQFRDRRMAEKLQKSTALSVLVAGNHHIQKDVGVPLHLADFHQQAGKKYRSISLMLKSTDEKIAFSQADYVWITN